DIEFSQNGPYVFYSALVGVVVTTEIYRLNLSDSTNELVKIFNCGGGFDLFDNDSVSFDSCISFPQINPVFKKYVIGTHHPEGLKFILRNIEEHQLDTLPDSFVPYNGYVGYPYWFPNGRDIVFMAKPYNEPAGEIAGEIWILTNLFDQIDTTILK
ncbi:MAG: hypothetical protein N3A65_10095, partial [candidate division WOR-3 bacterium]|nr:hypothetical protein [candidate division WOR-3 bacterium]